MVGRQMRGKLGAEWGRGREDRAAGQGWVLGARGDGSVVPMVRRATHW